MTTGLIRPMSSVGFEKGYHDNDYLAVSFISEKRTGKMIKEDTFCLLDSNIKIVKEKDKGFIFAVMDGMGGQKGGYDASSFVQSKLPEYFRQSEYQGKIGIETLFQNMFEEMLFQKKSVAMPETAGTTISLLYMNNRKVHAFNIGDSAIYLFSDQTGKLHPIFNAHEQDGIVSNYFGRETLAYDVDTYEQQEGDLYLVCSDGLIESMDDVVMENVIKQNRSAGVEKITHELYLLSRKQGSKDDLTLITIEIIDLL